MTKEKSLILWLVLILAGLAFGYFLKISITAYFEVIAASISNTPVSESTQRFIDVMQMLQ